MRYFDPASSHNLQDNRHAAQLPTGVGLLSEPAAFDLKSYLDRIGYLGPRDISLGALRALHLRHVQAIAFENVDTIAGVPVRLDTRSLQGKLVKSARGGYCFEQNLLFAHALVALGFEISGLAARVIYNAPRDSVTARTHMLLRVELNGDTLIADVGFGGLTLTAPLVLKSNVFQETPHGLFRLIDDGFGFVLDAQLKDRWLSRYRFTLEPHFLVDVELTNWYVSHCPDSRFITGLMAARAFDGGRYALRDTVLSTHYQGTDSERRVVRDRDELKQVLERCFGLRLPESAHIDRALERIVTTPARRQPVQQAF